MTGLEPSDRAPNLLVAPGVEIAADAVIGGNVVLHPGVSIGAGASIGSNVVLHPGVAVAEGCEIQDGAVLGKRPVLGRHTTTPPLAPDAATVLEPGARVGCHAVIVAGAWLGPGAVVADHSLVREGARLDAAAMTGHGGVIGRDCRIGARSKLMGGAILGQRTIVEEDVFCGPGLTTLDDLTMGRHPGVERLPAMTLRRGCRLGANVTLMAGVEIGEEAVVGAGSLVTRDVAPRTLVIGAPARVAREL